MNCSDVQELLSAYHDSELPSDEAARVATHLVDCSSCAEDLASFEQLSGLSRRLTDPPVPAHLWDELQSKLHTSKTHRITLARVFPSQFPHSSLAVAATVLVVVGIGVVALQTRSSHQSTHLAVNFANYLEELGNQPDEAQQILMTEYDGRPITVEEATHILGYKPLATRGLPPECSLVKVYLLSMPCCTCAQVICTNKDGQSIAIFEHDVDQPVWFGDRPTIECRCHDIPTSVMQVGDRLAATWKEGKRFMTIVGATDLDEVTAFVAHFKGLSAGTG